MAALPPSGNARVVTASLSFRTGEARYAWLNGVFAVLEGVLDSVGTGGVFRGRA